MLIDDNQQFSAQEFTQWVEGVAQHLPPHFCGVTQDTRHIESGALYVALRGERWDGHDFVAQALQNGAAAALVQRDWQAPPQAATWPLIRVADTRCALAAAAHAWRMQQRATIIGITGSSGKTTTKEMLAAMCGATEVCATKGNLNNEIGLPLSLLKLSPSAMYGVYEIGSNHPGEIAALAAIMRPQGAVISSIGSAHIEHFGTMEEIAREKGALIQALPTNGFVVLSRETNYFDLLASMTRAQLVTVSLTTREADFYGEVLDVCRGVVRVTERADNTICELASGVPGQHNASNLLLAFAAARMIGVSAKAAACSLRALTLPSMRWQVVERQGVTIINDAYNANPQSMEAALHTFMTLPCKGRRFVVLGDMLELGAATEELHRAVGRRVAELQPEMLIGIGAATSAYLLDEARKQGLPAKRILSFTAAQTAKKVMCEATRPGDSVLLKASRGMLLEQLIDAWQV